jgi:uncharacterized protein (DUF2236 family)
VADAGGERSAVLDAGGAPRLLLARRVNAECLTLLGWGRAILMQLAHPLIAAGVSDHSHFRQSPFAALQRLHGTVGSMLALTFGDEHEATATVARIREIHDRVRGRLGADVGAYRAGTCYSAHDPELLLWVHATIADSMLLAYEALVQSLTDEERNAYLEQAVPRMQQIGVPGDRAPRSVSDLRAYIDAMIGGRLVVSPAARALAEALVRPPFGPVVFPLTRLHRLLTIGLLPPPIREMYGYAWSDRDARRCARAVRIIRRARAWSPRWLACWPSSRKRSMGG